MSIPRSIVYDLIDQEREYQDQKWGEVNDKQNTPFHWATYIGAYTNRNLIGVPNQDQVLKFKDDMIKVAALAIAAIEALE